MRALGLFGTRNSLRASANCRLAAGLVPVEATFSNYTDDVPLPISCASPSRRRRLGEAQAFFGADHRLVFKPISTGTRPAGSMLRRPPHDLPPRIFDTSSAWRPLPAVRSPRSLSAQCLPDGTSKLTGWPPISLPFKSDRIGHSGPAICSP